MEGHLQIARDIFAKNYEPTGDLMVEKQKIPCRTTAHSIRRSAERRKIETAVTRRGT